MKIKSPIQKTKIGRWKIVFYGFWNSMSALRTITRLYSCVP